MLLLFLLLSLSLASSLSLSKSRTRLNAIAYNSYDASGAISKLHLDQQGAKTRRANEEKSLLKPGMELQEVKVTIKDQPSGTGFGSKADKKVLVAREWAKVLSTEGIIRINNCFTRVQAKELLDDVVRDEKEARRSILAGEINPKMLMGMELQRKCRSDFFISLSNRDQENNALLNVLQALLGVNGKLRELYNILVTKQGLLYEMAVMITDPGSDRQAIHADMPFHSEPPLYSIFAALQDVTHEMGPLLVLAGTNQPSDQKEWSNLNGRDDFLSSRTPKYALLKAGDLIVYDPRVLHCGTENEAKAGAKRAMFNLGFKNPKFTGNMQYEGSLRPLYADSITFEEFTNALDTHDKSRNSDPFKRFGDGISAVA